MRELSRWSKSSRNSSQRKARAAWAQVGKRQKEEDEKRFNATIVVATISCRVVKSGRKSKRNFVPPQEKTTLAPFAHMDGSPGWKP